MDGSECNLLKPATTTYNCNDLQGFPVMNALSGHFNWSYVMDSGLKVSLELICLVQLLSHPQTAIGSNKLSSVSRTFVNP
jgi:hypothetical protein